MNIDIRQLQIYKSWMAKIPLMWNTVAFLVEKKWADTAVTAGKQQGFNDQQVDRSQLDAIAGAPWATL